MNWNVHGRLLRRRQRRRSRDDGQVVPVRRRDDGGIGREDLVMVQVRLVEDEFGSQGHDL